MIRTSIRKLKPVEMGFRLAELRGKRSQQEIADALEVRRETIAQWEAGARRIKDFDIIELADYFNVSCDYILRGVKAENIDIHKETGLTDNTIAYLKHEHHDLEFNMTSTPDFLDSLLCNEFYLAMLECVDEAIFHSVYMKDKEEEMLDNEYSSIKRQLMRCGYIMMDIDDAVRFYINEAVSYFEDIVRMYVETQTSKCEKILSIEIPKYQAKQED